MRMQRLIYVSTFTFALGWMSACGIGEQDMKGQDSKAEGNAILKIEIPKLKTMSLVSVDTPIKLDAVAYCDAAGPYRLDPPAPTATPIPYPVPTSTPPPPPPNNRLRVECTPGTPQGILPVGSANFRLYEYVPGGQPQTSEVDESLPCRSFQLLVSRLRADARYVLVAHIFDREQGTQWFGQTEEFKVGGRPTLTLRQPTSEEVANGTAQIRVLFESRPVPPTTGDSPKQPPQGPNQTTRYQCKGIDQHAWVLLYSPARCSAMVVHGDQTFQHEESAGNREEGGVKVARYLCEEARDLRLALEFVDVSCMDDDLLIVMDPVDCDPRQ